MTLYGNFENIGLYCLNHRYFSVDLTLEKKSSKVKIPESIKGKKEVQENLNLAYDSVKIENEKEEVLECQPVTTS
ncbi:MAG: hypothetical protein DDT26_02345 [Dehalococcoidia bacterium]|nr:hypothetical protein [Chloroflexota bacterium]